MWNMTTLAIPSAVATKPNDIRKHMTTLSRNGIRRVRRKVIGNKAQIRSVRRNSTLMFSTEGRWGVKRTSIAVF
jgi:hypothetical protein